MHRVKWTRDHADLDRFREEVEILEEECKRAVCWHRKTASNWTKMASNALVNGRNAGVVAYAHRQSHVQERWAANIEIQWAKGLKELKEKGTSVGLQVLF